MYAATKNSIKQGEKLRAYDSSSFAPLCFILPNEAKVTEVVFVAKKAYPVFSIINNKEGILNYAKY